MNDGLPDEFHSAETPSWCDILRDAEDLSGPLRSEGRVCTYREVLVGEVGCMTDKLHVFEHSSRSYIGSQNNKHTNNKI